MRTCWKTHGGHRYLYSDYSGLGTDVDTLAREVAIAKQITLREPDASVLKLVNVADSVGTPEGVEILRQSTADTKAKIRRVAVLGVTGLKQLMAQGIARMTGQTIRYFDTEREALDWLVSEEKPSS
jgi:hypothetical protein